MNQIKFKDGTTLDLTSESSTNALVIFLKSIDDLSKTYQVFNEDNLSRYEIQNDSGLITAIYINKRLTCIENIYETNNGVKITVRLADVSATELRIKDLEAKINELLGTKGV